MTTRNNVIQAAKNSFYECLCNSNDLIVSDLTNEREALEEIMDQYKYVTPYEVVDPLEAFEICGSPEFPPVDHLDLSSCDNAIDALLLEANASVKEIVSTGWYGTFSEILNLINRFKDLAIDLKAPAEMVISFSTAPRLSFNIHNWETEDNILMYDENSSGIYPRKIEGGYYGLEKKLNNHCFMSCMFKPVEKHLIKPSFLR